MALQRPMSINSKPLTAFSTGNLRVIHHQHVSYVCGHRACTPLACKLNININHNVIESTMYRNGSSMYSLYRVFDTPTYTRYKYHEHRFCGGPHIIFALSTMRGEAKLGSNLSLDSGWG